MKDIYTNKSYTIDLRAMYEKEKNSKLVKYGYRNSGVAMYKVIVVVLLLIILIAPFFKKVEEVSAKNIVEKKIEVVIEPEIVEEKIVDEFGDDYVIEKSIELIKKFEGKVLLEAKWDYKQYSICFGTPSYLGEKTNLEDCEDRLRKRVQSELLRVNRMGDGLEWNKKVALVSFFYNIGYNYRVLEYAVRGDDKSVIYLMSLYNKVTKNGKKVKAQGLVNRRNIEIDYYLYGDVIN